MQFSLGCNLISRSHNSAICKAQKETLQGWKSVRLVKTRHLGESRPFKPQFFLGPTLILFALLVINNVKQSWFLSLNLGNVYPNSFKDFFSVPFTVSSLKLQLYAHGWPLWNCPQVSGVSAHCCSISLFRLDHSYWSKRSVISFFSLSSQFC